MKKEFSKYLPDEKDLLASAFDENAIEGTQAGMDRMASMSRRFAEWKIAEHIIDSELESGDIIVKDGSLQTSHNVKEHKYIENVFKKAKEKNVIFTGLSKTSRLTTDTQLSLIDSIQRLAKESYINYDKWCYFPVAISKRENLWHKALISVVKLNKHADTSYRFEIFKDQYDKMEKKEIVDIISLIGNNSRDIKLPGYPYGLIEADLWARVKNEELESYKIRLYSELSKIGIWNQIKPRINAVNSHNRLDGQ